MDICIATTLSEILLILSTSIEPVINSEKTANPSCVFVMLP